MNRSRRSRNGAPSLRQTPVWARRIGWACAAVAAVLALGACGSSGSESLSGVGATTAETEVALTTTAATANAGAVVAASEVKTPGCRHVARPAPRDEEVPKPSLQLNPSYHYIVTLYTNCGPIEIELAVKQAPKIATAFAWLVLRGYYNDLTFHRVEQGSLIQGGDPKGDGSGGPRWSVVEAPPAGLRYTDGVVAMANSSSGPAGTAGSQFFIVTGPDVPLRHIYALAGHVVGGQRAVQAIAHVPTENNLSGEPIVPRAPIVIERATVVAH